MRTFEGDCPESRPRSGFVFGGGFFVLITLGIVLGPWLWHFDATQIDIRSRNQEFSLTHPFGTDQLGLTCWRACNQPDLLLVRLR